MVNVKCPWCGRKKAVVELEDKTCFCTYCNKAFEREEV